MRVPASWRSVVLVGLSCVLAAGGGGCWDGGVDGPATTLWITRDFGKEHLAEDEISFKPGDTLLSQLRSRHEARAGDTDLFYIASIDGLRSRVLEERNRTTWATNVNGVETDVDAPDYRLYAGDFVQWDLRFWKVALDVRATVGAFPETFTRGVFGGRFPVTVSCERPGSAPCREVKRLLRRARVPLDGSMPRGAKRPPPGNPQRARILVGSWERWRDGQVARAVDEGPDESGVFARFAPNGRSLLLLDRRTHRVRSAGAGTGLLAAMRPTEESLLWMITGVDELGVRRAAAALDSEDLRGAFAAAVTPAGVVRLPVARP